MSVAYESIDPSSTTDVVYTPIQKPELEYEIVNTAVPVNDVYLAPNPLYSNQRDGTGDHDYRPTGASGNLNAGVTQRESALDL